MKITNLVERGAEYLYVKLGEAVVAIQQVALVKGHPMWEVERKSGTGLKKRLIVPARSLAPLPGGQ
ncbi:hypothetical protein [Azovibrio restrictus]|uniref:hypothetical protein n=1 Tax=Azovibrio restrictus TaxID=146938 RepID=UPI0012EC3123|nr:hypothetical protein [Azovibrio restrictus]MCE1187004.1 hypothetical protein [Rhodocyclales bacterium]MDD3483435.1 hypothetical protein [Azovibrio restrictus]